jgi:hypothetical protein
MVNDKNLSRRDWFRLGSRKPGSSVVAANSGSEASPENRQTNTVAKNLPADEVPVAGLTRVELPPNHHGMKLADLPPMREAVLQNEQIEELFDDIGQWADDIQLMQRRDSSRRAAAARVSSLVQLQAAKSALLGSELKRVQIRYRWNEALWIDTVAVVENGFRLVRIRHGVQSKQIES